jgi:hypothetical protein
MMLYVLQRFEARRRIKDHAFKSQVTERPCIARR